MILYDDRESHAVMRACRDEDWEPTDPAQRLTLLAGGREQTGTEPLHPVAYPRELCVPQLVAAQARAVTDAPAIAAPDQCLTYGELDAQANRLANYLRELGVGPEVLVGLCLERSAAMIVAALGILKAGGAYLPLDPANPPDRLSFMLRDARAPILVTRQTLASRLEIDSCRVVALDADGPAIGRASSSEPASGVTPADLAYVIYTSGSSGQPKGVEITHDSLLNLIFWHRRAFTVTPADRATQMAGPAFDAAVWELWPYLTAGASIHLPDEDTRTAPRSLHDWLIAQRITISFLPTALAEAVIDLPWPQDSALRILLTGADALHRYPRPGLPFALINNYGPTESTVVATSGQIFPVTDADHPPTIGRQIDNTQIYILDDELCPVSKGTAGEIVIGGAGLARGYRNRPDLTAERFIPNPFASVPGDRLYRTGDRGSYLPDGQIAFHGRLDGQVKIRGYRVELGEVVAVLSRHPAVQTCVVAARETDSGDKQLIAYLVPAEGQLPTASSLRGFLETQLPDYMVPATFVLLEALPLTANGKVDSRALPAPDAENTVRGDDFVAPRTPLEQRVATIVAGVLNVEQVGVQDNFFLLGGHSLLGTQVIARVGDAFGVELSLYSLFAAPTVAELAVEIERLIVARLEAMSEDEVQRILG